MAGCIVCDYVINMSNIVWGDIGSPADLSPASVTMKLTSDPFVGQVNVLLDTCFQFVAVSGSGCFSPTLGAKEQGIFSTLYRQQFYLKRALDSQGALGAVAWTELTEGDSTIRRASPNEQAKFYKDLYNSAKEDLDELVDLYRRNASQPKSIDYITLEQYKASPNGIRDGRSTPQQ